MVELPAEGREGTIESSPKVHSVPEGYVAVLKVPSADQLDPSKPESAALVGLKVCYKWDGNSGWCVGKVLRTNTDGRRKVNGLKAAFVLGGWDGSPGGESFHVRAERG